jgi:hypothetical protein
MVSTLEKDLNSNATNADNSDAAKQTLVIQILLILKQNLIPLKVNLPC